MVMAVFMDDIVNQVQIVAIETVDERETWSVPITEAHHTIGLEWNDAICQQRQYLVPFRPNLADRVPGSGNARHLLEIGRDHSLRFAIFAVAQGRPHCQHSLPLLYRCAGLLQRPMPFQLLPTQSATRKSD